MTHHLPLIAALTLGPFALTSCGDTLPSQPDKAVEPSPIGPSFASPNSWSAREARRFSG